MTSESSAAPDVPPALRYDKTFLLNMSSACKIERIVDRVRLLGQRRLSPDEVSAGWFRHIADPGGVGEPVGDAQEARPPPFLPFTTVLITGTAGAGKTSSIQALAANVECLITGTTVIASQNLSTILNRTRTAQIRTIYRAFGFNSKHVSIADRALSGGVGEAPAAAAAAAAPAARAALLAGKAPGSAAAAARGAAELGEEEARRAVAAQQHRDLSQYWPVLSDIARHALEAENGRRERLVRQRDREGAAAAGGGRRKRRTGPRQRLRANEMPDLCRSNVIVVDESGLLLRHMLHVVVFFYYFYNALYDTPLWREARVPCIVCVGSPTQTEALESQYNQRTHLCDIRRGTDVLTALISDPALRAYCRTAENWMMFINNKRCTDFEFGDLLKHIEFGLPLKPEHVNYVDRFVRPPQLIRDPSYALNTPRLFISHAEVKKYFCTMHDQLRVHNRHRLFDLPVYCVVNNRQFEEYRTAAYANSAETGPSVEVWFKRNLSRIMNYSQFVDHNMSESVEVERLTGDGGAGDGDEDGLAEGVAPEEGEGRRRRRAKEVDTSQTLLVSKITYIRDSSIGVNSKIRCCVVGFSGTFDEFVDVLQKDTFIEQTPCEQSSHAYSLITGLLYSGMYSFYASPMVTEAALREIRAIPLPYIEVLCGDEAAPGGGGGGGGQGERSARGAAGAPDAFFDASLSEVEREREVSWEAAALAELDAWEAGGATPAAAAAAETRREAPSRDEEEAAYHEIPFVQSQRSSAGGAARTGSAGGSLDAEISDVELLCSTDLYSDPFFATYRHPPAPTFLQFHQIVHIYTTFRDIFLQRYRIVQKHSRGEFGASQLITYNRRNVRRTRENEIVSHCGSFLGMLSFASPVSGYTLEGYTYDLVPNLCGERVGIHPRVLERGLPRLVLRDSLGFISVLDHNVSKFCDAIPEKQLHICTALDYGVNSRAAMTITKSQGVSFDRVAIDFGDNPRTLKMSQIYVAISRVVNSNCLVMNVNPLRLPYERNNTITPYICQALQSKSTTLIF